MRAIRIAAVLAAALAGASRATAQTPTPAPSHHHHDQVAERGDHVMGFDHAKTTHHFTLSETGGTIAVSGNDPSDTASRDAIRRHLAHEARKLAEGDFEDPMTIHQRVPPGAEVLKRDRKKIRWVYGDTPAGGTITITASTREDIQAVHRFLRFQIEDHATGDPLEPPPAAKK